MLSKESHSVAVLFLFLTGIMMYFTGKKKQNTSHRDLKKKKKSFQGTRSGNI